MIFPSPLSKNSKRLKRSWYSNLDIFRSKTQLAQGNEETDHTSLFPAAVKFVGSSSMVKVRGRIALGLGQICAELPKGSGEASTEVPPKFDQDCPSLVVSPVFWGRCGLSPTSWEYSLGLLPYSLWCWVRKKSGIQTTHLQITWWPCPFLMPSCSNWLIQNLQGCFRGCFELAFLKISLLSPSTRKGRPVHLKILRALGAFAMHQIPYGSVFDRTCRCLPRAKRIGYMNLYDTTITCWDFPPSLSH